MSINGLMVREVWVRPGLKSAIVVGLLLDVGVSEIVGSSHASQHTRR